MTEGAIDEIARQGYDPTFGARPLKRVIQQRIQNPLAVELLRRELPEGTQVKVDFADGEFTFEILDVDPPHRMVTRLAGSDLAVGGTWSWTLRPEGDGTIVEVREDGTIRSPIQRLLAHFVTGHSDSMESYLEALALRVGE